MLPSTLIVALEQAHRIQEFPLSKGNTTTEDNNNHHHHRHHIDSSKSSPSSLSLPCTFHIHNKGSKSWSEGYHREHEEEADEDNDDYEEDEEVGHKKENNHEVIYGTSTMTPSKKKKHHPFHSLHQQQQQQQQPRRHRNDLKKTVIEVSQTCVRLSSLFHFLQENPFYYHLCQSTSRTSSFSKSNASDDRDRSSNSSDESSRGQSSSREPSRESSPSPPSPLIINISDGVSTLSQTMSEIEEVFQEIIRLSSESLLFHHSSSNNRDSSSGHHRRSLLPYRVRHWMTTLLLCGCASDTSVIDSLIITPPPAEAPSTRATFPLSTHERQRLAAQAQSPMPQTATVTGPSSSSSSWMFLSLSLTHRHQYIQMNQRLNQCLDTIFQVEKEILTMVANKPYPPMVHLLKTLEGHRDAVLCLQEIPNTRQLLSGSRDKTILVWDMTMTGHGGMGNSSTTTSKPGGCSASGSIQASNVLIGHSSAVTTLTVFHVNELRIQGEREQQQRQRERAREQQQQQQRFGLYRDRGGNDGGMANMSYQMNLLNQTGGGDLSNYGPTTVSSYNITFVGDYLVVSGDEDGTMILWSLTLAKPWLIFPSSVSSPSRKPSPTNSGSSSLPSTQLHHSPHNKTVTSLLNLRDLTMLSAGLDGRLCLWDMTSLFLSTAGSTHHPCKKVMIAHDGGVSSLSFSHDVFEQQQQSEGNGRDGMSGGESEGEKVISSGKCDGLIKIWDLHSLSCLHSISLSTLSTSSSIATVCRNNIVAVSCQVPLALPSSRRYGSNSVGVTTDGDPNYLPSSSISFIQNENNNNNNNALDEGVATLLVAISRDNRRSNEYRSKSTTTNPKSNKSMSMNRVEEDHLSVWAYTGNDSENGCEDDETGMHPHQHQYDDEQREGYCLISSPNATISSMSSSIGSSAYNSASFTPSLVTLLPRRSSLSFGAGSSCSSGCSVKSPLVTSMSTSQGTSSIVTTSRSRSATMSMSLSSTLIQLALSQQLQQVPIGGTAPVERIPMNEDVAHIHHHRRCTPKQYKPVVIVSTGSLPLPSSFHRSNQEFSSSSFLQFSDWQGRPLLIQQHSSKQRGRTETSSKKEIIPPSSVVSVAGCVNEQVLDHYCHQQYNETREGDLEIGDSMNSSSYYSSPTSSTSSSSNLVSKNNASRSVVSPKSDSMTREALVSPTRGEKGGRGGGGGETRRVSFSEDRIPIAADSINSHGKVRERHQVEVIPTMQPSSHNGKTGNVLNIETTPQTLSASVLVMSSLSNQLIVGCSNSDIMIWGYSQELFYCPSMESQGTVV